MIMNFAKYGEVGGNRKEKKKKIKVRGAKDETYLMCLARCSLLLKTILHSP